MRHTAWLVGTVAVVLVGAWLASGVRGEEPALADRVATLERKVAALEARVTPRPNSRLALMEDMNDLRQIVALVLIGGKPPMKDGALDVYAFVRKGDIKREHYSLFRSARSGTGPMDEEIERGDYTNFRYHRYRGSGEVSHTRPVPLLWDKEPDAQGMSVVAFNDGSARPLDREALAKALEE